MRKKNLLPVIAWFIIKFNLLALPMYAVIISGFDFEPFKIFTAQISNALLHSLGYATTQMGSTIHTSIANIDISWDSTGWKSLYAITALAIATPFKNASKRKFLIMALPIIFVVNILRVVTTIGIALSYGMQYFDIVHLFLWREGLITAVVALWAVWLWREKDNITKDQGIFRWMLGR